jgi:hypothetical protein
VAALASAAVLVMGGTVAAIDEEIKAIEGGDKDKIKGWLTGDDLAEAMERHGLGGTPDSPKLQGTSNPNPSECDKTQTAPSAEPESAAGAPTDITAVIKPHLDAPVVAVVGPQGVGKSTFLQWLYGQIPGAAIALDPHAAKGDHAGLVGVGAGMDYGAIEGAVAQIRALVEERYRARAKGTTSFPRLLVVVEELTNWADKVSSAKALIKEALSDFRKAHVQLVLVSHGKTNALMGGSEGLAALRQSGMLLLEISEKGKGTLTIPGERRRTLAVSIPLLQSQPIERPPLPFDLADAPIITPPPADTPQAKVMRHLEHCPEGIAQGALIQKVADLKAMGKEAAVQVLSRMVLAGQVRAETTNQSIRYFIA